MSLKVSLKRGRDEEEDDKARASQYKVDKQLGAGAFAIVKLCHRDEADGRKSYAMKLVDKARTTAKAAEKEMMVLGAVGRHENVVSLLDAWEQPREWVFILELAGGGEVFDRICERGPYSEADAADVARQVGRALIHLHTKGVCHRDLKPENLLLCSHNSNRVKLADVRPRSSNCTARTRTSDWACVDPRALHIRPSWGRHNHTTIVSRSRHSLDWLPSAAGLTLLWWTWWGRSPTAHQKYCAHRRRRPTTGESISVSAIRFDRDRARARLGGYLEII